VLSKRVDPQFKAETKTPVGPQDPKTSLVHKERENFVKFRSQIAGVLLLFGSGVLLFGQQPALRLDELVSEALKSNPAVLAAQKRYEASRQRPTQDSSLPDPMFSLGYNSNGKPWPGAGLGTDPTSNIGLMVSQEIPFPGKLKLRGGMASKEAEAEFQQYESVQLGVISRLKQAYYRLYYTYATADVLGRNRDLLTNLLKVTEARYSVGKAAQQDVFKAQTQISIIETRLVRLEQEQNSREAEINSLLNRRAGTPLARPEDVQFKPFTLNLDEIYASVRDNSPMLHRDQKMIERTELAVNLARKEYYPDYTITAGYFNQGTMPPMYMARADVKVPIYFWRKQRAGVAEQVSNVSQARRNYEATDQNLRFRVKDDFLMAQASSKLVRLYSETVVPQASLALESSLSTYETGTVDFLSVLTNFSTVLEYEMNYYDELTNYYMALSRLEEMTAQKLTN
jgi:outer membrane protein TolC